MRATVSALTAWALSATGGAATGLGKAEATARLRRDGANAIGEAQHLPALWLFLIVFLWTPPHFWALALMIKEHYAAANVPMLPGTRGDRETTRQILLYSVILVVFTVGVGWWLGPVYTGAALLLGAYFLLLAWQLRRDTSRRRAVVLFHYSLAYLALLFVAAAVDPLLV